jgi:enoyl-CoA hydratase
MGLVSEVVSRGNHVRRAIEIGHLLSKFPQTAMRNDRRAVYEGLGKDIQEGLRIEARIGADTIKSGEAFAGAKEFQKGKGRRGDFG